MINEAPDVIALSITILSCLQHQNTGYHSVCERVERSGISVKTHTVYTCQDGMSHKYLADFAPIEPNFARNGIPLIPPWYWALA